MLELVGVDTGGTFTDFILYKNGSFVSYKIPSTPEAPEKAILAGLKQLAVQPGQSHIVHVDCYTTQAHFLLASQLLENVTFDDQLATLNQHSELKKLLLPGEMGERFQVMQSSKNNVEFFEAMKR